jgi:hypothetical protein
MHVPHRLSLRPALVRLAALTVITLAVPVGRATAQTAAANDSITNVTHYGVRDVVRDTVTTPAERPAETTFQAGAPLTGLRSAVHTEETARAARPNAMATNANLGQARAMMIVGGAALITGAIIGGDPGTVIMVGGAVIGLYGLYQYLQ